MRVGHMGYGSNDLNRVRGTLHDAALAKEHPAVRALLSWLEICPIHKAQIVLDIGVFEKTVRDVAEVRAIHRETVTSRFYGGLIAYCKMMGWPSYTMAEYRKMKK